MNTKEIKNHLITTVGKKPTKEEMLKIDKKIRKGYDKIYDEYDKNEKTISTIYTNELSKPWIKVVANEDFTPELKELQRYTKIKPNYKITSFASGLSVLELFIAKEIVPKGFVTCIDISEGMNKKAKEYAKKLKIKNAKILTSSVLKTPLKENSQDIVLARRTGLSKDKRWINVLQEASRILKKESTSTFIYTVDESYNDPIETIKSNFQKANLKFIDLKVTHSSNNGPVCMIIAKPNSSQK